jgi:hypothetical protein
MRQFLKGLRRQQPRSPRYVHLGLEEMERRLAPAATISLSEGSVIEPMPTGTVDLVFTATRTGDLASQVTVAYTTVAGTARANRNFTPQTGTTTFAPGSAAAQIFIPIFRNGVRNNPSQTFSVQLTRVVNVVGPEPSFAPAVSFFTGTEPISVAVGDFNGDGKPDLAVANASSNAVSVLLNTTPPGSPTPSFAPAANFSTGNDPTSVAVGDFNGDGKPDLAVANFSDNTVSVLLNDTPTGSPTPFFAPPVNFATGNDPYSLAVADFNGDGRPDLAVTNTFDDTVSVLMNETAAGSSTPAFAPAVNFATGSHPYSMAVGDFNGDGKPDLAIANNTDDTVSVLMNETPTGSPAPAFAPAVNFATGNDPFSVAVGDFNGDGRPDLAIANLGSNTVSVLMNTTPTGSPAPSFAPAVNFRTGNDPFSVAVADLNGDGKPDLAVANAGSNTVSVLVNETAAGSPTPSFAPAVNSPTGTEPFFVAVTDFNGDGHPDLATANFGDGTVSVLRNETAAGSPFAPAVNSSARTGPISVVVRDFNRDGRPDLAIADLDSDMVSVLLHKTPTGSSTSSFAPPVTFHKGTEPLAVAVRGYYGGGKSDLAVADALSSMVSALLHETAADSPAPSFTPAVNFPTRTGPTSVAVGDSNGDGRHDLARAEAFSNTVLALMHATATDSPTPSFALAANFSTGTEPTSVAAGDFNGEGKGNADDGASALQNAPDTFG